MTSAQTLSVDAKPEPFGLDPQRTAVIVVDIQNDFASEGGLMARMGTDISQIQAAVAPIGRVLKAARNAGSKVVYLKMEFRPDLSDLGPPDSANALRHRYAGVGQSFAAPNGSEGRLLVKDTWNTAIVDELRPEPSDIVVSKQRFSGFYNTELDTILKTLGVRSLVFTGCTTSVCVESTLRDACFRDYRCLLLADCTAEPIGAQFSRTNHEATLLVTEQLFGWVAQSAAFLQAVQLPGVMVST